MIDHELVTRKFLLIVSDLEQLRKVLPASQDELLGDVVLQAVVERLLERMITRMIDVNYHLLVESGEPPPSDYYQSFTRLVGLRALSGSFAEKIAAAAGLRNRLVREYDLIDYVLLHEAAQAALDDIPEYMRQIRGFIEAGPA